MVKLLAFRFQQHLGAFTMSLIERFSETRFFRYFFNHVFRSLYLPNTSAMRVFSFSKSSKFSLNCKNAEEKLAKISSQCVNKQSQDFAYY